LLLVDRDQEDHGLKPVWANRLQDSIWKKFIIKKGCCGVGPEFKPQCWKKKRRKDLIFQAQCWVFSVPEYVGSYFCKTW
jgi:hypothetical protein